MARVHEKEGIYRKLVATLAVGAGFGELALTLPNSKRQATVIASALGCEIIVISRAVYDRSIGVGSGTENGRSSLSERVSLLQRAPVFSTWYD
jgi:hypothetical protein